MAYVEVEKVLETARNGCHSDFCRSMADLTSLREVLGDTPTADVAEVRHGEWKIKVHALTKTKTISCPECGYSTHRGPAWDSSWGLPPYCQECGAKMDGGKV